MIIKRAKEGGKGRGRVIKEEKEEEEEGYRRCHCFASMRSIRIEDETRWNTTVFWSCCFVYFLFFFLLSLGENFNRRKMARDFFATIHHLKTHLRSFCPRRFCRDKKNGDGEPSKKYWINFRKWKRSLSRRENVIESNTAALFMNNCSR